MIHLTTKNNLKSSFSSILGLVLIIAGIVLLSACSKSDNNDQQPTACAIRAAYKNDSSATQRAQMIAFCNNNGITYTIHPSGILYQIITPGDTAKPNLCASLTMTYTGKLMTGIQFDKGTITYQIGYLSSIYLYKSLLMKTGIQFDKGTITYPLKDLIVGWQIAVPLIGKGGKIKMVIPSSLAYGPNANGSIPANSPLYFEMSID
jgi:FKBP-type peptidyl-prolyl cis-trans isomerase